LTKKNLYDTHPHTHTRTYREEEIEGRVGRRAGLSEMPGVERRNGNALPRRIKDGRGRGGEWGCNYHGAQKYSLARTTETAAVDEDEHQQQQKRNTHTDDRISRGVEKGKHALV
jgi:hypothetical protein